MTEIAGDIDWSMSAALADVPRGDLELAEVTNLERAVRAVRAWLALGSEHRSGATLTLDRPLVLDGVTRMDLEGEEIQALVDRLPANADEA